ncbi:MAG: Rne/Rng family ribonuclease [Rhizobiaceae bacterium]|nr:Rne/Rng family ribonuclease [Rhizobiaceae bacterium]
MANKMLIDASHPEETRVVVTRGNRIEEFDFESQDKKQLRGNIYLARVTRVEPSLQAAFVEYGGNRHGFLAFSEIHPDYYQIPVADRQALLKAEAEAAAHEEDEENNEPKQERDRGGRRRRRGKNRNRNGEGAQAAADDQSGADDESAAQAQAEETEGQDSDEARTMAAEASADVVSEPVEQAGEGSGGIEEVSSGAADERDIESVGAGDALDEARDRRRPMRRHYKIQEVIKRRQILLVQVVKEERGNKGAALTTYLSLAGRYSVLMPNTARGGGISRKITSAQDRKRLKDVVKELEVPQGMGVILRTAGENRTKAEIKRDYEYLMRMWENVRNLTLKSTAPTLVYEEGSLIKRSVRDLYNKDIDEILVAGDDGYREAKDFMRMLMPSHAKMVQPYRDTTPIFARSGIEAQLDRMVQPQVTLRSGGYIIINQTEALVSIDVNSGRSTREHSIEDTAVQTNLEAAEEIARQLRLRDLAGLIVIDFIDMEESRNNRAVEKKLKDCLKNDRARIQVGRISHFGLLEMSRQRIRASVLESTMKTCPHCGGTGHVRSDSSVALLVVRAIEEHLLKDNRHHITVRTPSATALYVLNHKRSTLVDMERRFGLTITIESDDSVGSQHYAIARGAPVEHPVVVSELPQQPVVEEEDDIEIVDEEVADVAAAETDSERQASDDQKRKRKRRRRRRGGRDRDQQEAGASATDEQDDAPASDDDQPEEAEDVAAVEAVEQDDAPEQDQSEKAEGKKRRRGKRGGKRSRAESAEASASDADEIVTAEAEKAEEPTEEAEAPAAVAAPAEEIVVKAEPVKKRATRTRRAAKATPEETIAAEAIDTAASEKAGSSPANGAEEAETTSAAKPRRSTRRKDSPATTSTEAATPSVTSAGSGAEGGEPTEPKKGWWQRKGFFG